MKTLKLSWALSLIFSLLLASCRSSQPELEPTPDADAVMTAAASTANVQLTENARMATATPTLTDTPQPSPTATETPEGEVGTATEALATATQPGTSPAGEVAEFWADVTVPDGTNFNPGERITKTWRLRNGGLTTWTTSYSLVFIGGAQMGGPNAVQLTRNVAPGDTVDISVDLVAPMETGNYRGFWKMRNDNGAFFDGAVYVEINVTGGTPAATGTPTAPSTAQVTNVSLSVDPSSATSCPHTFIFTGAFTLSGPASVTYVLEAGSSTPNFQFNLPGPLTGNFEGGTHKVIYNLTLTDSVDGWAQLRITAPNEALSNQVAFKLDCP